LDLFGVLNLEIRVFKGEVYELDQKIWYAKWDPRIPKVFQPQKSILQYLKDNVTAMPDKVAISFYGYDLTYSDLDRQIENFAGGLIDLGVKKGDRVALYMQNCPQLIISYFGAMKAGAIVVSLNPMFKHAELEYEINDSGAETLIALDYLYPEIKKAGDRIKLKNVIVTAYKDYLPEKPELPLHPEMEQPKVKFTEAIDFLEFLSKSALRPDSENINLEDSALLQYTGGTTGLPKGAIITHYTLVHNVIGVKLWFNYIPEDIFVGAMPFFHVAGMVHSMCASLISGGRLVIISRFNPEVLAKAIERYKCTILNTITTMYTAILDWPQINQYDLNSLRIVWEGGAPMLEIAEDRLKKLLPKAFVGEGYGLTETLTGGLNTPIPYRKRGYIGIPFISTDISIVDLETGNTEVKLGEEGEIVVKGPCVMQGYWNNPEETKEQIREGWLHTGDIGKMDEEGYVAIVGRKKELIKCSGFSVFPTEVENLLCKHPMIAEAAVIGISDPYRGETPKAYVVLKPEFRGKITEQEILAWAKDNLAPYKRPSILEFRSELPKSGAGKILGRVLAEEERKKRNS
jgi:acyl-CoA synthetase (AMP-forming)/AMP-acid ligase II